MKATFPYFSETENYRGAILAREAEYDDQPLTLLLLGLTHKLALCKFILL